MRRLSIITASFLAATSASPAPPTLQVFPNHFRLRPGEQVHYSVLDSRSQFVHPQFTISDPRIARLTQPAGMLEALHPGRTELVVRASGAQRRIPIEVAGDPLPPMPAVPHQSVRQIVAKDLLFVGHANLDGYDHTAAAKPGIDRLVQEARKNGATIVYWVSQEYPDWYTDDRHPDYAIVSEGQEHQIVIDAERVVFTGGSFMFCLLRNVQMTLHSMILHQVRPRIHFVFPADAIWRGPVDGKPYPAPMTTLAAWFALRATSAQKYDEVVVPFLDRVVSEFPVAAYPSDPPSPPLKDLLQGWTIVVRFPDGFERVYQRGSSDRFVIMEFTDRG